MSRWAGRVVARPPGPGPTPACSWTRRPLDAVPGHQFLRDELHEVARTVVGRHQIFRSVLAEVADGHAVGDLEALALHRRRAEHDLRLPLRRDAGIGAAVQRAGNADIRSAFDVQDPGRALARHDPERLPVPFLPGRGHVRHALVVDGGDAGDHRPGQERLDLGRRELAVLAHPFGRFSVRHLSPPHGGRPIGRPQLFSAPPTSSAPNQRCDTTRRYNKALRRGVRWRPRQGQGARVVEEHRRN